MNEFEKSIINAERFVSVLNATVKSQTSYTIVILMLVIVQSMSVSLFFAEIFMEKAKHIFAMFSVEDAQVAGIITGLTLGIVMSCIIEGMSFILAVSGKRNMSILFALLSGVMSFFGYYRLLGNESINVMMVSGTVVVSVLPAFCVAVLSHYIAEMNESNAELTHKIRSIARQSEFNTNTVNY